MSSYTMDYSNLNGLEKQSRAIQDIKDYLSQAKFEELTRLLKAETYSLDAFRMVVSFAGITGYPAAAWHAHCYS